MTAIGHVKIALATNSLTHVDTSFTFAKHIVFYDVSYDTREFLDTVRLAAPRSPQNTDTDADDDSKTATEASTATESSTAAEAGKPRPGSGRNGGCCFAEAALAEGSDRLAAQVDVVRGCAILFCKELNDLAAVRLHEAGIFPIKIEQRRDIDNVIDALQKTMNHNPPLWLRKALGYGVRNPDFQLVGSV